MVDGDGAAFLRGGVLVLRVVGEVDLAMVRRLREYLYENAKQYGLCAVWFMHSVIYTQNKRLY